MNIAASKHQTETASPVLEHGRDRARRAQPAAAWSGVGPIHGLRGSLLTVAVLAITPLVVFASGMALMRAQETDRLTTAAAWITVAAVPLLIGLAAVLVVGIAAEALVMNWLTYLERLSRAYARGRYSLRPRRLQRAPLEFRALGEAVEEMAAAVEHRDQALRDALDEQTVLLREVHHRVKNNLQIVGSLLSLQASRTTDAGAKRALQDALVRIDAMSLSQRFMQQQEEEERISSAELFEAFAGQVRARLGSGPRTLELTLDVEAALLPLDSGSRMALTAAEALLCAFRASDANVLCCRLGLAFHDDGVLLELVVRGEPDAFHCASDRVSRDLIEGYVRQLHGRLEVPPGAGRLSVFVPMRNRAANDAQPPAATQGLKFFRLLDRTASGLAS